VTNATAITAGGDHSCALSGPSWECWGENADGEIGSIGSATCDGEPCTLTPTRIVSNASAFSTGYSDTCMVVSGQVQCLGDSTMAVIGTTSGPDSCRGGTNNCALTPQSIYSGLFTGVSQVSSYNTAACAIVSGGGVVCWGEEGTGEIGPNGTSFTCSGNDSCSSPVAIPGIANAVALAGGQWSVCALISNQTVECWGSNEYGQLGSTETATCEGFPYPCSTTPYVVSNLSGVTQIAAGADFACALLQNGTVQCWGNNAYDELGNSGVTGSCQGSDNVCSSSPVPVSGVSGATAITAGSDFGCALTQNGQVLCWGEDSLGQLGNGTTTPSLTAVPVQF
jgi:alpha-tubulin suppressor-like RCC1 family protein